MHVHDLFAGMGKTEDGEKGSALIGAVEIKKIRAKFPTTPVTLNVNEKRARFFNSLKEVLYPFKSFVNITNEDANDIISSWSPIPRTHNLFFIDPHGYTQVSTENLKKLFSVKNCDFLVFVPIYHIYRFLKPNIREDSEENEADFFLELGIESKNLPKIDKEKLYQPIAEFLSGLGIDRPDAEMCSSVEDFSDLISSALKKISGSEYIYTQMIKKHGCNSKYCLFFISHHILGAEKFLEAQQKVQISLENPLEQSYFDFVFTIGSKNILSFVELGKVYDNIDLYELAIKAGICSTEAKKQIKALEKNKPHQIGIDAMPNQVRNNGGLYIDYKHYKDKLRKISVRFSGE